MASRTLTLIFSQKVCKSTKHRFWKSFIAGLILSFVALSVIVLPITIGSTKASSATIYVPDDYPTIQEAIDAASSGDTVQVAAGTYYPSRVPGTNTRIQMKEGVNLVGSGAELTIIDGNNSWDIVTGANNTIVEKFTITGSGPGFYAMRCESIHSFTIRNNILSDNNGGGIGANRSSVKVANNIIVNNGSSGIDCSDHFEVINNTIVGNDNYGIQIFDSSGAVVKNNIVMNNYIGIGINYSPGTTVSYNDVSDNDIDYHISDSDGPPLPGTGDISANPLFVNPANNDYHLQPGSPCIDAGDPSILDADGSRSDMGAYGGSLEPTPEDNSPTIEIISPSEGETVWGTVRFQTYATDDHGLEKVEFYIDDELKVTHGPFGPYVVGSTCNWDCDTTPGSITYIPNGKHIFKAKAYDIAGQSTTATISFIVQNIENQPPTCRIELRKEGTTSPIDEINIGEFFDIYVGGSTDDTGIDKVRFSSDDSQDGSPTGEWTSWYDWNTSSGDWNAETKTKKWSFATSGNKEVWAEVKDDIGQTDRRSANIYVPLSLLEEYAPVLYLHQHERYYPWGIYSTLDECNLTNGETVSNPRLTDLMIQSHNNENYKLDLRDADAAITPEPKRWEGWPFLVYGRKTESSDYPQGFVLQYWFYYPYNWWNNTHEGDWELIQILYSKDKEKPEQLTFAHHHTFTYPAHSWEDISTIEETHTKVFIARGSHGNWATSGDHPVGKIPLFKDETSETATALYPEGVDPSSIKGPANKDQYTLIDISAEPSWVKWQGWWGAQGVVPPRSLGVKNGWDKWNKWDEPIKWMSDPPSWYYTWFGSPGHLHVYDPHDNHVGLTKTGEIETNIPGTAFYVPSFYSTTSEELVWINTSENLRFVIEATESGTFDFTLNRNLEEENLSIGVTYEDVQITETTIATVDVNPENPMFVMELDLDGDGITDEITYPNYIDGLVADIQATIDIDPDTLNLKSKGEWITSYIELPEGHDVNNIDIDNILLMQNEGVIAPVAESSPSEVNDYDEDGIPDLMVKFDRTVLIEYIKSKKLSGEVTLTVVGGVNDKLFAGTDTIKIEGTEGATLQLGASQPKFGLSQNYPNPCNPETTIEYGIEKNCQVTLKIYNIAGQLIKTLVDEYQTAGYYTITWYGDTDAGGEVASGVYFYRIKAGDFVSTKKMVVLK